MLRFFNSDSVNVEHQLAAKHIICLLASDGTLHVLHYLCARAVNINEIGFLTEKANFLVFFLRKITILWGWVFLAMARCQ